MKTINKNSESMQGINTGTQPKKKQNKKREYEEKQLP